MNTIKKVEVFGFKSFYNRKELIFPPHMNVVMGPNGSGKSNVADAICFALGKTSKKELRAERMGHLVFHGSKKLPPSKFAKVTIYIDNSNHKIPIEEDEIRISRKVDPNGNSVYKVNGNRQPLEYVRNMLYQAEIDPDGYNIVMQGEIEKFIGLSPEERRKIIEELAGISIYEEKKHKSMLELEKVEAHLNEARIVLNEKIRHMENLKKEKEQAEKKAAIQGEYDFKKASRIFKEMQEIDAVRQTHQKQLDKKEAEISELLEKRNKILVSIDNEVKALEDLNNEINRKGGTEQVELTKEIEGLRTRTHELRISIESNQNEIKRIEERVRQLENDLRINSQKKADINKTAGDVNSNFETRHAELKSLEEKFQKLTNVDRERIELMTKLHAVETEILKIKEDIGKFQRLKLELDKKDDIESQLKKMQKELQDKLDEDSALSKELGGKQNLKDAILREMHLLEGKREAMLRMLDQGAKAIIDAKDKGKLKGIYGIVSELGKADEKYALPLRVAAGSRANAIVVENVDVARECIEYLRKNELGLATFLPLDKIKGSEIGGEKIVLSGFINYAIKLIKFSPKYKNVFDYVLGDTIVVDDIDSAKSIGINRYRMVTLCGDLIEKTGSMHGGYHKKEHIGFKEEPIEEQLATLKERLSMAESGIFDIEPKVEKISDEISILRGRTFELERQLKEFEKIDMSEVEKLQRKLDEKQVEQKRMWEEIKELPKNVAKDVLAKLNERITAQRNEITALEGKKKGAEVELQVIDRDIDRANQLIKGHQKEKITFESRIKENERELASSELKLSKKLEDEKKFHGKLEELYDKRNKLMEKLKDEEIRRGKIETETDGLRGIAQEIQLKLAEINAKIEGRKIALEEFKGIEITAVKDSIEEITKQILELENQLSNFGNVNMRALDVYKEVEREYNEIKVRADKLIEEKSEVIKIMGEVESQKKDAFMETFNHVSENFARVFSIISINGEGKMLLENPESPFEAGVDIIARPGGKKVVSLRSMSGGEKTLTTLAFIFAVQEYTPSPFYIMDEVDAALDKENSERLGMLISKYAETSQFIIISHNDSIISQADNVYGVSMNELGESHIISMKLPEK
ncbi:MAG: chromosome segregation protein SMC [Candidatus Nanoarchaeia archaeon]|nr:chromosome segregation protein SMC [Candidatus Nanoarchaeia archaeon]MDD5239346.1 chromosome segregation protein SMC [Candidatus Nanoarchaeia archaeon]